MADNPALKVVTICGSLRKGSYNAMVAAALPGLAPAGMTITAAPSIADIPIYNFDIQNEQGFPPAVIALADAIRAADGVVIITPEYNYSIPGGLKNAIDWLSRMPDQPFAEKPVAIQSVSPGPVGGGRMQHDLRKVLVFLDAFTLNKPEILVANVTSRLNEKTGELTDETTRDFIRQQLAALGKLIKRVEKRA